MELHEPTKQRQHATPNAFTNVVREPRAEGLDLFQHAATKDKVAAEYLDLLQSLPDGALEASFRGFVLKPRLQTKVERLDELEKQHPDIGERSMDLQSARVKARRAGREEAALRR